VCPLKQPPGDIGIAPSLRDRLEYVQRGRVNNTDAAALDGTDPGTARWPSPAIRRP
jgi:hypothetical protein